MSSAEHTILNQYYYADDYNEVIFPRGYMQIADCLASELSIKHANVTKIDYSSKPVVVITENGERFEADYVVSTIPLGVLQNNENLFNPKLSEDENKKQALENLGMGTMDKMYLIFDNAFWDKKQYNPGDNNTYIHRVVYPGEKSTKSWKFFLNVNTFFKESILLAFHTGSTAKIMDGKDDDELEKESQQILQKMFPNSKVNEPKIVRTQWTEDPWSLGSYSFVKTSGSSDDFDRLAEPLEDKVFFAGEATVRCSFGTVHGAYTSGYRAAREILALEDNIDSEEEQLRHGIEKWQIVGNPKPTEDMIPIRCGGYAE